MNARNRFSMRTVSNAELAGLLEQAAARPRRRTHRLLHQGPGDPIQRLFIGLLHGTYVRPHRHPLVGETGIVVRGSCELLTFDGSGTVLARHQLGPDCENLAFDLKPGEWHSLVVRSADALFFELKPGPYDPETISEFADWAPAEGSVAVPGFLEILTNVRVGESVV